MVRRRCAKWIAFVGALGLLLALSNGFVATSSGWLVSYILLIALFTMVWAVVKWELPKIVAFQILALSVIQSVGIWTSADGGIRTPSTYLAGALLGFLVAAPIAGLWITTAWGASRLEERIVQSSK